MANQTFDSVILNQLERPLSSDLNAAQSDGHRDLRDFLNRAYARRLSIADSTGVQLAGFVSDGFRVVPPSPAALAVSITPGLGFAANPSPTANVGGVLGLNDLSPYSPIVLSQAQAVTLAPAPGAGFARVDLIQVKVNRRLTDVTSRDIFNPGTLTFGPVNVAKTMSFDSFGDLQSVVAPAVGSAGIVYKQGTQFAYAVANDFLTAPLPAVDPGYLPLAYINVTPAMASVAASNIRDARPLLIGPAGLADLSLSTFIGPNATLTPEIAFTDNAALPPGVSMNVVLDTGSGGFQYFVYLFAGDATLLTASPYAFPSKLRFANLLPTRVTHDVSIYAESVGTINAAQQADLANLAKVQFASNVAIGQTYKRFDVRIFPLAVSAGEVVESSWVANYPSFAELGPNTLGFKVRRNA